MSNTETSNSAAANLEVVHRWASLVNSGDMDQNLPLRPGDVLVVPESRF